MSSLWDCLYVTCNDCRQSWTRQFDWLLAHACIITWRHCCTIINGYWLWKELNTNSALSSSVVDTAVHHHTSLISFDQLHLWVGDLAYGPPTRCLLTIQELAHYLVTEPLTSSVHALGTVCHCMFAMPSPCWLVENCYKLTYFSVLTSTLIVCMFYFYFILSFLRQIWSNSLHTLP